MTFSSDMTPVAGLAARTVLFGTLEEAASLTAGGIVEGRIALSGGFTFAALFGFWLTAGPDTGRATFFPVDERVVPFEDPGSNWGMTYRKFLLPLGRESDKKHWPQSAAAYTSILEKAFGAEVPVFDTVFLGAGDDGHTASLFPGGSYLDDRESAVLETISPKPPLRRITLGPAVLCRCKRLIAVVSGMQKTAMVRRLLSGDSSLPLYRVLSLHPSPELFVERRLWIDAAGR
jgi:6-phosphogluconolactonase